MSEIEYAVVFEDSGGTYATATSDRLSEDERYMEKLEEERYEEQLASGELEDDSSYEAIYSVEELDADFFSDDDYEMLQNGWAIRIA